MFGLSCFEMTPQLAAAVDKLYQVFSKYAGNPHMEGSLYYGDLETWNAELFSKPLQALAASDLNRFTGKAMTTWGTVDDFKHFLPRILELTAAWDAPHDVSILFGKLSHGEWHSWAETEQASIREYMLALWETLLQDGSGEAASIFQEYFSVLGNHYPGLTELLETWERHTSKTAIKRLANFVFEERHNLFDKGFLRGFDKPDKLSELKRWLLSDRVLEKLEKAYMDAPGDEDAETISWAEKMLRDERSLLN